MKAIASQLADALPLVEKEAKGEGASRAERMVQQASLILSWLHWYRSHRPPAAASELAAGTRASVLEAVSYIAIGFGRAALTSIRTQIDLLLSFTYFKDHPVEWARLVSTGDGFMLRGDVYNYHRSSDRGWASRLAVLEGKAKLSLEALYKMLSAHIHGQSPFTVPNSKEIRDLIWNSQKLDSIVEMQGQVATAISNFLLCVHAKEWVDLPREIIQPAQQLLGDKQTEFFSC